MSKARGYLGDREHKPAFPNPHFNDDDLQGLSFREYLIGQCAVGASAAATYGFIFAKGEKTDVLIVAETFARISVAMADALMIAMDEGVVDEPEDTTDENIP